MTTRLKRKKSEAEQQGTSSDRGVIVDGRAGQKCKIQRQTQGFYLRCNKPFYTILQFFPTTSLVTSPLPLITARGFSWLMQNLSILGYVSKFPQTKPGCYPALPIDQLPIDFAILPRRSPFPFLQLSLKVPVRTTLIVPTTFCPPHSCPVRKVPNGRDSPLLAWSPPQHLHSRCQINTPD